MIHNVELEIMKEFTKNIGKDIYGREFAKKKKLNNKTVSSKLILLEKKGILKSKTRGKTKHYFINMQERLTEKYLLLAEISKAIRFFEKNPKIKELFSDYFFEGVLGVFGSYAKGLQKTDSDLDIFVIGKLNNKEIEKRGRVMNLEVNIHKMGAGKLKKGNPLVNEILENHVILFGAEKFILEVVD